MGSRNWYLLSYDIRDERRWRGAYQLLRGYGERIQYSLFKCWLSDVELEKLRWELSKILEDEDDLLVIRLCPACSSRVEERQQGAVRSWNEAPPRFRVL